MSASPAVSDNPPSPATNYRLEDDGVTHVNIYSKGKTSLGQALSNFACIGFTHPKHGVFLSLEGFWYYIKTGYKHEHLRNVWGFSAKVAGKKLEVVPMEPTEFQDEIRQAITLKIEQHPDLLDALLHNKLPLAHYYVMGEGNKQFKIEQSNQQWQIDHLYKLVEKWSVLP